MTLAEILALSAGVLAASFLIFYFGAWWLVGHEPLRRRNNPWPPADTDRP